MKANGFYLIKLSVSLPSFSFSRFFVTRSLDKAIGRRFDPSPSCKKSKTIQEGSSVAEQGYDVKKKTCRYKKSYCSNARYRSLIR